LEVSVGYDRNFLVDRVTREQKLFFLSFSPTFQRETPLSQPKKYDDQVLLLTGPTASFISDSQRRQLAFTYGPEFEIPDGQNSGTTRNGQLLLFHQT
jgi:hypothetical protein